jgi:hypothetical protein
MEPSGAPRSQFSLKGKSGLIAAVAIVAVPLIGLPAYRIFFAVSLLIGLLIAGGLYWWNETHPVREEDVEDTKHPLGLNR